MLRIGCSLVIPVTAVLAFALTGGCGSTAASEIADAAAESGQHDTGVAATDAGGASPIEYADAARLPVLEGGSTEAGPADAGSADQDAAPARSACACDIPVSMAAVAMNPNVCPTLDTAKGCGNTEMTWTTSERCDQCTRFNCEVTGASTSFPFPPCCDIDGTATSGPATGTPLFGACSDLFSCAIRQIAQVGGSGTLSYNSLNSMLFCGAAVTSDCTNTDPTKGPEGACAPQVEAAFQGLPTTTILDQFTSTVTNKTFSGGSEVLALLSCMVANCADSCFPAMADSGASADGRAPDGGPPPVCQ